MYYFKEGDISRLIHTYHAVPLPCRVALIHTSRAVPLPSSDSAVLFVKPHIVVGRNRTWADRPKISTADVNSHIPRRAPAVLCRGLEKSLAKRHGRCTTGARRGHGMECVN